MAKCNIQFWTLDTFSIKKFIEINIEFSSYAEQEL